MLYYIYLGKEAILDLPSVLSPEFTTNGMLAKLKKARRCFISQDISFTPIGRLVKTGSMK